MADQTKEMVQTGKFTRIKPVKDNIIYLSREETKAYIDERFEKPDGETKILTYHNNRAKLYNRYIREELHSLGKQLTVGERVVSNSQVKAWEGDDSITNNSKWEITGIGDTVTFLGAVCRVVELSNKVSVLAPLEPEVYDQAMNYYQQEGKNGSWGNYFKFKENVADLRALHSSTTHKAQGGTFDEVLVDLSDIGECESGDSDVARLLNVALSRARHKVYLTGSLPPQFSGEL